MGSHDWTQSDSEVVLKIPLSPDTGKDKLKVKVEPTRLAVTIAGEPAFAHELFARVDHEESFWSLDGAGATRCLLVTLCKKKPGNWKVLTKAEHENLPEPSVLEDDFDVINLEHNDDDPERVEEQEENERKLEARYKKLMAEKGLQDESTLETFFALFDNCIQLYRLDKLDIYLKEVVPACRKRTDKYKLKAIQALSFVRWKQSRFREALPLFLEMEEILGKGAALCENIAHTYNSLGDYDKAEDYFRQALKFIESEHGSNKGNRGGVLLGLGIVRDRLGKHREALPVCTKAYEFFKERANGAPASLQAKAGLSCSKLHMKLGNLPKAEAFIREAVGMYEVTCGETSPLTASAYHELGKVLWAQRKRNDAQKALARAYELESMKDAWDLVSVLEIHNLLMDTHLKETDQIERGKFVNYISIVDYVVKRVRSLPQDGNAAVYYKAAAELKAWGGRYTEAKVLFNDAVPLFEVEKSTDCTGLISSCREMLAFCDRNLVGTQNSPMEFEIPAEKQGFRDEDAGGEGGMIIEELDDDDPSEDAGGAGAGAAAGGYPASAAAPAAPARDAQAAAVAASPAAPEPSDGFTYRTVQPADFAETARVCAACRCEPLLGDRVSFDAHLAGAGAGICLAAVPRAGTGGLEGFALCGSDGVFGNLLQLVVPPTAPPAVRRELAQRCATASRARGLRGFRAPAAAGGAAGAVFEELGWRTTQQVYEADFSGRAAGAARADAGSAPASSSQSRPADKVTVDKDSDDDADALDSSSKEEFGEHRMLDVASRISKYSWDQTNSQVSLYISFDGAKALREECIECHFRPRGVLLIISHGGKQHWFKIPNLCHAVDTAACKQTVKTDTIALKLRKAEQGLQWSDLTDEKDQYKQKRAYRIEKGDLKDATTEQLIADMYQNANDEEREGLREAMRINREKRAEDARNAATSSSK